LKSGAISEANIAGELGELLLSRITGRSSASEITVFKSLGIATQDLVLAGRTLDIAERKDLGMRLGESAG
jgi:alanine dehydrogenase